MLGYLVFSQYIQRIGRLLFFQSFKQSGADVGWVSQFLGFRIYRCFCCALRQPLFLNAGRSTIAANTCSSRMTRTAFTFNSIWAITIWNSIWGTPFCKLEPNPSLQQIQDDVLHYCWIKDRFPDLSWKTYLWLGLIPRISAVEKYPRPCRVFWILASSRWFSQLVNVGAWGGDRRRYTPVN